MSDVETKPLLDFLRGFSNAIGTAFLYSVDHPQVAHSIPRLAETLRQFLGDEGEQTLVFANDLILYQGKPLERDVHTDRLAKNFARQRIGFVRFSVGVTAVELRQLLRVVVGVEGRETLREQATTIRIGDIEVSDGSDGSGEVRAISSFEDLSQEELGRLVTLYEQIGNQEAFNLRDLTQMIAGFIAAFRREANPFLALAPLRMLDEYTFTHSVNVCILNLAQGMSLGIGGQTLHDLGVAGMLHDAGKIFVDKQIVNKPDRLTDAEWEIMKQHPSRGAQYLLNQPGVPRVAVVSAYEHHMRFDLNGYPKPPPGWRLNLASQMTMISDTFDALRTRRVYKEPWDFPKTSGHMCNLAGSQLNPDLTMNFLRVLGNMGEASPEARERGLVP